MPRLEISLLSYPKAYYGGKTLRFNGKQPLALLVYLAMQSDLLSRERAAELLFDDLDDVLSRSRFRRRLAELVKSLRDVGADNVLIRSRHVIGLDKNLFSTDVQIFEKLAKEEDEKAVNLYSQLLEGFDFETQYFSAWLGQARAHLNNQYSQLLFNLSSKASQENNWAKAAEFSEKLILLDPLNEDAQLIKIEALWQQGKQQLAKKQYDLLREKIREELDLEPLPKTKEKFKDIVSSKYIKQVTPKEAKKNAEEVFVGREQELIFLHKNLEIGTPLIHIYGDSGVGKTKLLKEFAKKRNNVKLFQCYEDPSFPYIAFTESYNIKLHSAQELNQAAEQIANEIADQESTILIIDDAQWLDESSFSLLPYLLRRLNNFQLIFLSHNEPWLRTKINSLHCSFIELEVSPLSKESMQLILKQYKVEKKLHDSFIAQVGGNTFYLIELINAHLAGLNTELPASIKANILAQFTRLSEAAKRVANLTSIMEQETSSDILQASLSMSEDVFVAAVEELEQLGFFISESKTHRFRHRLQQEVLESELSSSRKRLFHKRIAKSLLKFGLLQNAAQIVPHAKEAMLWDIALLAAKQAAKSARHVGARIEAADYETEALSYMSKLNLGPEEQFKSLMNRENDYDILGLRKQQLNDIIKLENLTKTDAQLFEVVLRHGKYCKNTGELQEAQSLLRQALELSKTKKDVFQSSLELSYTLLAIPKFDDAYILAKKANKIAKQHLSLKYQLEAVFTIAMVLIQQDKFDKAIELLEPLSARANVESGLKARLWILLAEANVRRSSTKLENYANKALRIYKKSNYLKGQAASMRLKFIAAASKFQFQKADLYLAKAIKYYEILQDKSNVTAMKGNAALLNNFRNRFSDSIRDDLAVFKDFQDLGDKRGQLISAINLARNYNSSNQFSAAERWSQTALKLAKELKMLPSQALALTNLGTAQRGRRNYKKSLTSYQKALSLYEKTDMGYGFLLGNLAIAYLANSKNKAALDYIAKAEIWLEQNQVSSQFVPIAKAYIHHRLGNKAKAQKALSIASQSLGDSLKDFSRSERNFAFKHNPTARFVKEAEKGNWLEAEVCLI